MINILALPGSLRSNSSSNLILNAIVAMAPKDINITVFHGIGNLPHFNDASEVSLTVTEFKDQIKKADAVLICTPEYAFGVPGSLKNAIDLTVSSGEFVNKPVGLVTASSQGEKGHAAMLLILTAISSKIIDEATLLIPFVKSVLDVDGKIKDDAISAKLNDVINTLIHVVDRNK